MNASGDKDQEYFSEGLAEELINDLSRIPGLQVTARSSAFKFTSNDDPHAVRHKTECRRHPNRQRAPCRKKAEDHGATCANALGKVSISGRKAFWPATSTMPSPSRRTSASKWLPPSRVTLLGGAVQEQRPSNPEAYNLYLQGRYWSSRISRQNLEKGRDYAEQAIKLDPNYAPAWRNWRSSSATKRGTASCR